MNFYSFAESLFFKSRSFDKEEQKIFEKIRNKVFKEIELEGDIDAIKERQKSSYNIK